MTADPRPVELLASEDARRLQTAIDTAKPLPASSGEECAELLERQRRRVSIADVERFHDWTRTGEAVDPDADIADLIDEIRRGREEA